MKTMGPYLIIQESRAFTGSLRSLESFYLRIEVPAEDGTLDTGSQIRKGAYSVTCLCHFRPLLSSFLFNQHILWAPSLSFSPRPPPLRRGFHHVAQSIVSRHQFLFSSGPYSTLPQEYFSYINSLPLLYLKTFLLAFYTNYQNFLARHGSFHIPQGGSQPHFSF